MAFQVSPGVEVKEIDLTNVIPAVSTSIGGFAGYFNTGPVGEIKLIGSEKELAEVFGKPGTDLTGISYYQAASFLKYGNALKVVRVGDSTLKNAQETANATSAVIAINTQEDYEALAPDGTELNAAGKFVARYPGTLGNSIQVNIINAPIFNGNTFQIEGTDGGFNSGENALPIVSAFAGSIQGGADLASDEVHIVISDSDGGITGTAGTILETYEYVSTTVGATKDDGTSNYIYSVLLDNSEYVYAGDLSGIAAIAAKTTIANPADLDVIDGLYTVSTSATQHVVDVVVALQDGVDASTTVTEGDIETALQEFVDAETEDVNLLFAHPDDNGSEVVAEALITIADGRKDCVALVSPPIADSTGTNPLTDVKAFVDGLPSSSYAVADSGAIKVYDKYNDRYLFIPASGFIAGLCANTDSVAEPWFSPAGYNRGQILGATKLAYNPKKADRDELYKARINPIVSFPGQGTVLFGDKTLQSKPSAFDRINVRRLFIVLEKAIATAAKFQLFELNDEFTRAMFRNMVEPFLRDVKGRRGITDFLVVCDETNNTSGVIDANRFVADIYIKPARSINFITLNFIATRTGVEFSEIVGK
jgi:phage tail sheath protein FI